LFSLLGMLVFNWLIAGQVIPNLPEVLRSAPSSERIALAAFGGPWEWGPSCSAWGWIDWAWPWITRSSWG